MSPRVTYITSAVDFPGIGTDVAHCGVADLVVLALHALARRSWEPGPLAEKITPPSGWTNVRVTNYLDFTEDYLYILLGHET